RKNPKIIPSTGSDRIEGAFVARAALSWRLPAGFDIQLVVDNLFDAVYFHPSNLPPSRFRQPPRSFRLAAGYSFQ
ncbi:MAG TPA: TonB-dependent receptor, partial [Candidatus Aminicenantes bacterium]|nr:TonB-dependent receptor [Candidatus Aminicenantes bacterium]